jgi:hypothetical protein
MDNIKIFCEGISDQRFLRDFISLNYNITITDKQLKDNSVIHCLGGWSKLSKLKSRITKDFSDYTSLIFLDADDINTVDKSGIIETRDYIDKLMSSWDWEKYDKYIFPNNENSEGEVEDFLENIINPNNKNIFDCWRIFEDCLKVKNYNYNIPAKKSKIYLYHEVLHGDSSSEKLKCKDSGRDFKNENLWELQPNKNQYLSNLKSFLDKYLI